MMRSNLTNEVEWMWRMQDAADDARCPLASLFPSFSSMILPRDLSAEGQGPRFSSSLERALKAGRPHRGPRSLSHAPRSGAAVRARSAASACSLPPARRYVASCGCFPFERRRRRCRPTKRTNSQATAIQGQRARQSGPISNLKGT